MVRASEPVRVTAGTSIGRRERKPPRSVSPHGRTVRSQCSGTHTESGCQGWWDISQRISTTRAAPRMRGSRRGIRAQPMTSRFAQLIDALNRESRQILHRFLRNCVAPASRFDYEQLSDGIKLQNIFECRDCALETIRCQQESTTRYSSSFPVVENLFRIARCLGFWRGGWNRVWIRALIRRCRSGRRLGRSPLFLLQLFHRRQARLQAVYLLLLLVDLLL